MLLAIETSTRQGSVAVLNDEGQIAETRQLGDRNQAATLAPVVAELLDRYGPPDLYAIDVGPGSFTGLRVGLAFLKGLAAARPAGVVAVRSLEVLAAGRLAEAEAGTRALPILEASGPYVFAAGYVVGSEGGLEPMLELPVGLYRADALASEVPPGAVLVGTGMGKLSLPGADESSEAVPSAETLARLAWSRRHEAQPAARLEPEYHQPSAAEANLARALAKKEKAP